MAFVKKTWKDRISQYPNRRTINDGNFTKVVTVGRDEGTVTQAGDAFNASNMNDLENRIEAGLAEKPDREEVEDMVEGFFPLDEASGAMVSINPGVMLPLRSCECQINAYQAGTSDPSPSNVRAINGFTGIDIVKAGKNIAYSGLPINVASDGSVIYQNLYNSCIFPIVQGKKYTHSVNGVAMTCDVIAFFTDYPNLAKVSYNNSRTINGSATFTAPVTGFAVIRHLANTTNIQVEEGTTATSYEPNNTTTVDWGINQWNEEWESGSIDISTGQDTVNNTRIRSVGYIKATPNTSYYCFKKSGFANLRVHYYTSDKTWISVSSSIGSNTTINTPANCYYIRFAVDGTTYNNDTSINFPATYTGYFPHIPNNPGVVYGGKINVTTGELIVDKALVDNSTVAIQKNSGSADDYMYYMALSNNDRTAIEKYMCSHVKRVTALPMGTTQGFMFANAYNVLYFNMGVIADNTSSGMRQYLINNNVQFVYPLANPIVYNLDPVVIKTLFNQNNIYHDCNGDIDVIYHKALTAKNIYFDNSGTTLTATNVEDAIKEVLGRI